MAMAMRSAITTHGFAVPRDEFNAAPAQASQPQISLGELAVDALQQLYALAAMQYEWRQFANACRNIRIASLNNPASLYDPPNVMYASA